MSQRGQELSASADGQIAELIDLLSALDQTALDRPCTGREKLGDGTIARPPAHTADNYERIVQVEAQDRRRVSVANLRSAVWLRRGAI